MGLSSCQNEPPRDLQPTNPRDDAPPSRDNDTDTDDTPETPLDEPRPPRVEDPPTQPDSEGPYVVQRISHGGAAVNTGERKERRGFASMSPEKQREIASKGGRAAHEKGTAHEWSADEARNAGRKGGQVSRGGRGRLVVPADTQVSSVPGTTPSASGSDHAE
jgi:general stress protein YciG